MQLLHDLLGIITGHQEAQVVAGCAVANHADVERIEHAEHFFAYAAGLGQLITDDSNQRQVLLDFYAAQR